VRRGLDDAVGAVAALSTLAAVTVTGLCGPMSACSLDSRSATTSASSSCSRTRAIAMRSQSPVTEYTSLMPGMAEICSATSGIFLESVWMKTNAVIMVLRSKKGRSLPSA
jgi:hypothetical protein